MSQDLLIGIDAGTSVMKAVAFDPEGRQVALAAVANEYATGPGGAVTQPMARTWSDCARALRELGEQVDGLARRVAAVAVTGQGDGTWLIDGEGRPVTDAFLWLDGRATGIVRQMRATKADAERFRLTGAGLNACQMGTQLIWMKQHMPEAVAAARTAFHCKDWLYYNLTGERVTDMTEGNFTFGDFRTRKYSDVVIETLGLEGERRLMPPMIDGTRVQHALTTAAAVETGLAAGTPVVLAAVDIVCTGLGSGLYDMQARPGVTIVGSTGVHMRMAHEDDIVLTEARSGYVMPMPAGRYCAQIQTNMASTLNIDWLLRMAHGLLTDMGHADDDFRALIRHVDDWLERGRPGEVLYHPYISEAGERGPFVDGAARASFIGLNLDHGFPDLLRAVVEGLGHAGRDCYEAIGGVPDEVRLSGGAARSKVLRRILGAALNTDIRTSSRLEAGAAGAAMIAAIGVGAYPDIDACAATWVTPHLGTTEAPDADLAGRYGALFKPYRRVQDGLRPVWSDMATIKESADA